MKVYRKCKKEHSSTHSHKKKYEGAEIKTQSILKNAIRQGSSFPSDSTMAVGPEVMIATVNTSIAIFNKSTMERIMLEDNANFWPGTGGGGDVQIIYDELSQRFFAESWVNDVLDAELDISAPAPAAGTYIGKLGAQPISQAPFNVSALIEPTIPANANTPVTNNLTGKIALIATDSYAAGGAGTITKGNHAAAAGAIGCIFYDSTGLDFKGSSINGSTLIPSILVDYASGQTLLSNLSGLSGTIKHAATQSYSNFFNLAVSKTSTPKTSLDWFKYQYTNAFYNSIKEPDYPKISVDKSYFYLSTQDFFTSADDILSNQADILILDKADLVNGVGATLIEQSFFPHQQFLWPAQIRVPITDVDYPAFFVGTNANIETGYGSNSTALRIYKTPSYDFSTTFDYVDVPYPTPMVFAPFSSPPIQQSPDVAPLENISEQPLTAVVYKDSLLCAHVWGLDKSIVRWYELDISKVVSHNEISIKQWGDIDSCTTSSLAFPAINIDNDGNMGISFVMAGPNLHASIAYTGRLKNDPLGSTRFPLQIVQTQEYLYDGGNQIFPTGGGDVLVNRWGDYTALVVDPVDHKTFYIFQQLASDSPFDIDPTTGISYLWTTTIASFTINKNSEKNNTTPQKKCSCCKKNHGNTPSGLPVVAPVKKPVPEKFQNNNLQ